MNKDQQKLEIERMKAEVKAIEAYKAKLEKNQLTYPLDEVSRANLKKDIIFPTGYSVFPVSLVSWDEMTEVSVNEKKYLLYTTPIQ